MKSCSLLYFIRSMHLRSSLVRPPSVLLGSSEEASALKQLDIGSFEDERLREAKKFLEQEQAKLEEWRIIIEVKYITQNLP